MRDRFGDFLRIGNIGMTNSPLVKDLLVLTADPTMQSTIQTLLEKRRNALGISSCTVDFQTHRHRNSGCRTAPGLVINPLQKKYRRAMVVFDFHGSGESRRTASQLEIDLERDLRNAGWGSRQRRCRVHRSRIGSLGVWLVRRTFARSDRLVATSEHPPMAGIKRPCVSGGGQANRPANGV